MVYNLTMGTFSKSWKILILLITCIILVSVYGCSVSRNDAADDLIAHGDYQRALSILEKQNQELSYSAPEKMLMYPSSSHIVSEPEQNTDYYAYEFDDAGNPRTVITFRKKYRGLKKDIFTITGYYPGGNIHYIMHIRDNEEEYYCEYYDKEHPADWSDEKVGTAATAQQPIYHLKQMKIPVPESMNCVKVIRQKSNVLGIYMERQFDEKGMIISCANMATVNKTPIAIEKTKSGDNLILRFEINLPLSKEVYKEEYRYVSDHLVFRSVARTGLADHAEEHTETIRVYQYEYDTNGMLVKDADISSENAFERYYEFNDNGKLLCLKEGDAEAALIYEENRVAKVEYNNGYEECFSYNEDGKLISTEMYNKERGYSFIPLKYIYDDFGRIAEKREDGRTLVFRYDW